MLHGQVYGSVGFQSPAISRGSAGKPVKAAELRSMFRDGKLSEAKLVEIGAGFKVRVGGASAKGFSAPRLIDHARAVREGYKSIDQLIAQGVDLRKANAAYLRSEARKLAPKREPRDPNRAMWCNVTPAHGEAVALANGATPELAKLVSTRKAKRANDKAAKKGRTLTAQEIAALNAQYAR